MGYTTVGEMNLGDLRRLWSILDRVEAHAEKVSERNLVDMGFTDRRFDEATRTGQRMYINARSLIGTARDNHKALEDMLSSGRPVRPHAPWSLIRPSLESSFYVAWTLGPDESRERKRRSLRIAWEEERQFSLRAKLLSELAAIHGEAEDSKAAAVHKEHTERYLAEAHVVGLSRRDLTKKIVLTEELAKLAWVQEAEPGTAELLTYTWRELSGLQHGDVGTQVGVSDLDYRLEIPGGFTAAVSINDDSFIRAATVTARLQLEALRLYVERSTKVTQQ